MTLPHRLTQSCDHSLVTGVLRILDEHIHLHVFVKSTVPLICSFGKVQGLKQCSSELCDETGDRPRAYPASGTLSAGIGSSPSTATLHQINGDR